MSKVTFSKSASYKAGAKAYSPRVEHNAQSWERIQKVLAKGKGSATGEQILKALTYTDAQLAAAIKETEWHLAKQDPETGKPISVSGYKKDHSDFAGYLLKGGYLATA